MWNKVVIGGRWRAAALFLSLSGCTALSDCKYEFGQKYRTSQAWHEFDGCNEQCFTCDYRDGWKRGYYDVLTGGEGQPPLVPPKKYWKPPVFTKHDPSLQNEWYTGYQDGASCAKSQPDFHYVPTFLPHSPGTTVHAAQSMPAYIPFDYAQPQSESFEPAPGSSDRVSENPAAAGEAESSGSPGPVVPPTDGAEKPMPPSEGYEKDPEPSSTATPGPSVPVKLVAKSSVSSSLVRQLVLNANAESATDAAEGLR